MHNYGMRFVVLLSLVVLLASCFGPKTPQEVTKAFWQAVVQNDVDDAVKYSTLPDAKSYDAFSRNWQGYQPAWGRVTIDGNVASIITTLSNSADAGHGERKFATYLVKRNDNWLVDFDRTNLAVHGGALGSLFEQLNQFGNDLGKQLDTTAENFKQEMERMSRELEQMAKSFGDQASKSLNQYSEKLRNSIQALEDSINRALKDDKDFSDQDRHVLRVAAKDLERNRQELANPSIEVVAKSSMSIGNTQQQLETVDGGGAAKYKHEWRELSRKIETEMRQMLDELQAGLNRHAT